MRILLTGATGFIGRELARRLVLDGHEIVVLTRDQSNLSRTLGVPCESYNWQATAGLPPEEAFQNLDGIIHMLGENIADGRWSAERKRRIRDSRVLGTRHLVEAVNRYCTTPLNFFFSFSAIGYYPSHQHKVFDEDSPLGQGFLAAVCQSWEEEASKVQQAQRLLILRIGTVLGFHGGAVKKLRAIYNFGVGGPIGSGLQWMSWIHIDDLINIIMTASKHPEWQGVINAVAPEPITNRVFSQVMARTLKRPNIFAAPALAVKIAMGQMSQLVLDSQRIVSKRLPALGFQYRYGNIDQALAEACGVSAVGLRGEKYICERLEVWQYVEKPLPEVFAFFSEPQNLEKITPTHLQFQIVNVEGAALKEGSLINYQLKLWGLPIKWQSKITEWEQNHQFVDIQLQGPYQVWHHRHQFFPYKNGTLIFDRVDYKLPFGYLGMLLGQFFVRRSLAKIFRYRFAMINKYLNAGHLTSNAAQSEQDKKSVLTS